MPDVQLEIRGESGKLMEKENNVAPPLQKTDHRLQLDAVAATELASWGLEPCVVMCQVKRHEAMELQMTLRGLAELDPAGR